MKVSYISDLHIDFWINEKNPESVKFQKQLDNFLLSTWLYKGGDVLIIAGDLGHYFAQDTSFLLKLKTLFKNILIVPGNHDMYLISKNIKKEFKYNSMNRINAMKQFCKDNDIHYLDGNVVEIDGVKFGGCGMSWDSTYYEILKGHKPSDVVIDELFKQIMNDSRLILGGADNYEVIMPYSGRYLHTSWDQRKYFEDQYNKLQSIEEADVIVSHYTPVVPSRMRLKYEEAISTTFYMFDGLDVVNKLKPKFWIHGHMHDKMNYDINGTKFLCNPLGYPGENTYTVMETFDI